MLPLPGGEYAHAASTQRLAVLNEVARDLGATPNQVVLAWLLASRPPITPRLGPARMLLLSPFVSQTMVTLLAHANVDDLAVLRRLLQTGKVTPVIDRTYPLNTVPEAIRYLKEGTRERKGGHHRVSWSLTTAFRSSNPTVPFSEYAMSAGYAGSRGWSRVITATGSV